ncbi:MAG: DUF2975 domain-containing protein [Alphaproteobacteria bacterium]|jgi:hypothetical protein|nr:DUF2975 domain-containing protein [Alphaproteobacteria bacterium]
MNRRRYSPDPAAAARADRMNRIRRVSAIMAHACLAVAALLTLGLAVYWWVTPAEGLFRQAGLQLAPPAELATTLRLGTFAIAMTPLAALVYGLFAARRCFAAFAAGHVFSREAIGGLRAFAVAAAISALLQPLAGAALGVVLSGASPTGGHSLVINVGSDTLLSLLFAAMVGLIAWILAEATEIADENQQFV